MEVLIKIKNNLVFKTLILTLGIVLGPLVFLILFIFLLGPFCVWSNIAYLHRKVQHGKRVSCPSTMDNTFSVAGDKSSQFISAALRMKGKIDLEYIRGKFTDATFGSPNAEVKKNFRRFTQIFEYSYQYGSYRDDDNFNVNNHIKVISPQDIYSSQEVNYNLYSSIDKCCKFSDVKHCINCAQCKKCPQCTSHTKCSECSQYSKPLENPPWEDLVNNMMRTFAQNKVDAGPQWEILLLRENEEHYTCMFRFHHHITDGINFVRLICETLREDKRGHSDMPYHYQRPNVLRRFFITLLNLFCFPFGVLNFWFGLPRQNPLHGPKLCAEKHYVISKEIPVSVVKEIKERSNSSMNEIFFSCFSHAIAVNFKKSESKVEKYKVLFPISLNNVDEDIKLVNNFRYSYIELPTSPSTSTSTSLHLEKTRRQTAPRETRNGDVELNMSNEAMERLRDIKKRMVYLKSDLLSQSLTWILEVAYSCAPKFFIEFVLSTRSFLAIYSSVAASKDAIKIFKSTMTQASFMGFDQTPSGIFLSILGYNGSIRVGLTANKALIKDESEARKLIDDFTDQIWTLHRECSSNLT